MSQITDQGVPVEGQLIERRRAMNGATSFTITNRQAEWQATLIMILAAFTIAASPGAIMLGGFSHVGLPSGVMCAIFFVTGCGRAAALYANGRWSVYGQTLRVTCAVVGTILWSQLALSQLVWSSSRGYVTLGFGVYVVLFLGEIVTIYRIMRDGRTY